MNKIDIGSLLEIKFINFLKHQKQEYFNIHEN